MKINFAYKNILKLACLMVGLAISGSASAGLINTDFTDVLNGWKGDVTYFDSATSSDVNVFDVDFANFDDNFSRDANSVTLTTSVDLDNNEYWVVSLFREFEVKANFSELSLNFDSNVLVDDIASIVLFKENGDEAHDFINSFSMFDISHLVGTSVRLDIILKDGDYQYGDYLTVSNIAISEVPEPSSFAIFAIALLALRTRLITR